MNQQSLSALLWSVADLLRGDFKQFEYGKVILPFTVLRRLDCVLEPTKAVALTEFEARTKTGVNPEAFLLRKAKHSFYNTSAMDVKHLIILSSKCTLHKAPIDNSTRLNFLFNDDDFKANL